LINPVNYCVDVKDRLHGQIVTIVDLNEHIFINASRNLPAFVGLIFSVGILSSHAMVTVNTISRAVTVPGSSDTNNAVGDFSENLGIGDFAAGQKTFVSLTSYFGTGGVLAESSGGGQVISSGEVTFSLLEAYNYTFDVFLDREVENAVDVGANWSLVGPGGAIAEFGTVGVSSGVGSGMLMAGDYTLSWDAFIDAPALAEAYYDFSLGLRRNTHTVNSSPEAAKPSKATSGPTVIPKETPSLTGKPVEVTTVCSKCSLSLTKAKKDQHESTSFKATLNATATSLTKHSPTKSRESNSQAAGPIYVESSRTPSRMLQNRLAGSSDRSNFSTESKRSSEKKTPHPSYGRSPDPVKAAPPSVGLRKPSYSAKPAPRSSPKAP
jgi:hypothetical protein